MPLATAVARPAGAPWHSSPGGERPCVTQGLWGGGARERRVRVKKKREKASKNGRVESASRPRVACLPQGRQAPNVKPLRVVRVLKNTLSRSLTIQQRSEIRARLGEPRSEHGDSRRGLGAGRRGMTRTQYWAQDLGWEGEGGQGAGGVICDALACRRVTKQTRCVDWSHAKRWFESGMWRQLHLRQLPRRRHRGRGVSLLLNLRAIGFE